MKTKFEWNIFTILDNVVKSIGAIEWWFLSADDEAVGCDSIWNTQLSLESLSSICLCKNNYVYEGHKWQKLRWALYNVKRKSEIKSRNV